MIFQETPLGFAILLDVSAEQRGSQVAAQAVLLLKSVLCCNAIISSIFAVFGLYYQRPTDFAASRLSRPQSEGAEGCQTHVVDREAVEGHARVVVWQNEPSGLGTARSARRILGVRVRTVNAGAVHRRIRGSIAGRAQRLFGDGKPTPYVENVLKFVEYQAQFKRTQAFCARGA